MPASQPIAEDITPFAIRHYFAAITPPYAITLFRCRHATLLPPLYFIAAAACAIASMAFRHFRCAARYADYCSPLILMLIRFSLFR